MTPVDLTAESLCVLGAGSMGQAIVAGLLSSGAAPGVIRLTCRSRSTADRIRLSGHVDVQDLESMPDANIDAVRDSSIVIIGLKPAQVARCLIDIAPALSPGAIVVSIAAGVTISSVEQHLPETVSIMRAIPNTPAEVRKGVTAISVGSRCSKNEQDRVRALFAHIGSVFDVPESQLDAVTAITSSGPAYVFYVIEQLTTAAILHGFTEEQATAMVGGTFSGATELLRVSKASVAQLRRDVTSPGGTTAAAVAEFERADVGTTFANAVQAALDRARQLGAN